VTAHAAAPSLVAPETVDAHAKLTLSLRITGVREDGYHLLDAEMVSIDLADSLVFQAGTGISVVDAVPGALGVRGVPLGSDNLVGRALSLVGRDAAVRIVKRIPPGAGLGGGSADAAAVLRWAGVFDRDLAVRLGADVPFCVRGGRARVRGVGETLDSLPFEPRHFVVLLLPLAMDTGAVYRAWDERRLRHGAGTGPADAGNDLEEAALALTPDLACWRDRLAERTGQRPRLAGSGSSWFVEGEPASVGLDGVDHLTLDGCRAPLVAVRTVPAIDG